MSETSLQKQQKLQNGDFHTNVSSFSKPAKPQGFEEPVYDSQVFSLKCASEQGSHSVHKPTFKITLGLYFPALCLKAKVTVQRKTLLQTIHYVSIKSERLKTKIFSSRKLAHIQKLHESQ